MKIVIIDDEMLALQSFLSNVIDCDAEYKFFKDGLVALDYIIKNPIDAVFTDIRMPNIDGLHLAEKIIDLYPDIPIVFITGMPITIDDLHEKVKANTIGFVYKPFNHNKLAELLNAIKKRTLTLSIKMFDGFDCFVDGKLVIFSSSKSKELFALLITYNGKSLIMTDAISLLWGDYDVEKAKILYRNAVFRLRKTLADVGINCVGFKRAMLTLDKSHIQCDYWDYLTTGQGAYRGEFCKSYDWSIDYLPELDKITENKRD